MTCHTPKGTVANTSMFRAGLLALLYMSFSHPTALSAAPIVLQATTLTSVGCGPTLTGDNFSLDGVGYNAANQGCGGRIEAVGIGQQTPLVGTLNVPDNPGRFAIAYSSAYQPSLYKFVPLPSVPDNFTGTISVNVVLSGTVQVCLADAGVPTPGAALYFGCDPQFADFGVININVAGVASYYAYNGDIGIRSFLGFSGTSAAAPEPAHLGLAAGAILLFLPFVVQQQRRRTRA